MKAYELNLMSPAERVLNAVLHPLGWDCVVERHDLPELQWGVDRPSADNAKYDLWLGRLHVEVCRNA